MVWGGRGLSSCAKAAPCPLEANSCPADNHDIISMKLFQLMYISVRKLDDIISVCERYAPSFTVDCIKSPKGMHEQPLPVGPGLA